MSLLPFCPGRADGGELLRAAAASGGARGESAGSGGALAAEGGPGIQVGRLRGSEVGWG